MSKYFTEPDARELLIIVNLTTRLGARRYAENEWEADIEIDEDAALDDLNSAILRAVRFQDDHSHEFYIARDSRSRNKTYPADIDELGIEVPIKNLFPLPQSKASPRASQATKDSLSRMYQRHPTKTVHVCDR